KWEEALDKLQTLRDNHLAKHLAEKWHISGRKLEDFGTHCDNPQDLTGESLAALARIFKALSEHRLCDPLQRNLAYKRAVSSDNRKKSTEHLEYDQLREEAKVVCGPEVAEWVCSPTDLKSESYNDPLSSLDEGKATLKVTLSQGQSERAHSLPSPLQATSSMLSYPTHLEISIPPTALFKEDKITPKTSDEPRLEVNNAPVQSHLSEGPQPKSSITLFEKNHSRMGETLASESCKPRSLIAENDTQAQTTKPTTEPNYTLCTTTNQPTMPAANARLESNGAEEEEEEEEAVFYAFVILHAPEDEEVADRMKERLEKLIGSNGATFSEEFAIPGKSTLRCVEDAINNSAFTLLLLTRNFNTRMQEIETNSALMNSINNKHKYNTVIPLLPQQNSMPKMSIPLVLRTIVPLEEAKSFDKKVQKTFSPGKIRRQRALWNAEMSVKLEKARQERLKNSNQHQKQMIEESKTTQLLEKENLDLLMAQKGQLGPGVLPEQELFFFAALNSSGGDVIRSREELLGLTDPPPPPASSSSSCCSVAGPRRKDGRCGRRQRDETDLHRPRHQELRPLRLHPGQDLLQPDVVGGQGFRLGLHCLIADQQMQRPQRLPRFRARASIDAVPDELVEPLYRDQYNQEHLKPPVACLLQSAELYCRAGSLILRSDAVKPLLGHNAVIQALAQKGLYVTDQDRLVTERDLTSTPIHMKNNSCQGGGGGGGGGEGGAWQSVRGRMDIEREGGKEGERWSLGAAIWLRSTGKQESGARERRGRSSHLALIDTLMMAYTVEMVSVERVMSCINRYSSAEPSHGDGHIQELPYDTEDAITTWINKVNEHLRDILVEEQKLREASYQESNATQKARYRKEHAQHRSAPSLPLVENLLKDNTDGCALTTLLHFYCPQAVRLEDICLKETMSLADSLYNLQLVQEFCRNNLNHCCHFSLEDMLYAHASIKSNYLVFMAELFWWFEVVKPSFVQPRVFDPNACEPVSSCRNMAPVSSPVKQSYPDRADSPESIPAEGVMKRSTSMSYVDGCIGTWPKEKRSSSRGISFEIPLDEGPTVPPCEAQSLRGMTRSASSDGLGFKVHFANRGGMRRHLSLAPVNVNGQSRHIPEEEEDFTTHRPLGRNNTFSIKNQSRYSNGVLPDSNHSPNNHHSGPISPSTPPSIEEALKIIHDTERPHASLGMGDGDNGFFLHGASDPPGAQSQGDDPGAAKARLNDHDPNSVSTDEVDTGIHVRTEDIQSLDEDSSSLRDYSDIDPDCEAMTRSCPLLDQSERERTREGGQKGVGDTIPEGQRGDGGDGSSPCPSSAPTLPRSHSASPASSSGGSGGGMVRMTSFAEQKFRKLEGRSSGGTTPESSDLNVPYTHSTKNTSSQISTPPLPITSPSPVTPSPRDPSHLIASEMIQLRMKLEEKRRAIEAQKKKVEAAFTRHRQRMGRTAFLNVVRRKGVTAPLSPSSGGAETPSPEPLTSSKETSQDSMERAERCKPDGAAPKSPCEDGGGVAPGEIDLADYTRSIERLNTSLGFLQTEMQRLAQQQEKIMSMREQQQQAWVIPPPAPSPHRQLRELRSSSVTGRGSGRGSVGSLSPILSSSGSPHAPNRSPAGIKRRPASFHARTPRTPRPNDLKVTPFSRMLNTPTSVDSLPRLRRFTTSQTQLSSFAYLGHDARRGPGESKSKEAKDNKGNTKDREEMTAMTSAGTPQPSTKDAAKENDDERQEERKQAEQAQSKVEAKQTRSSEVLSQPVSEIQAPSGSRIKGDSQDRRDLVEVPLSRLKTAAGQPHSQEIPGEGEAAGDAYGEDQKMCCGFFFKDDVKGEEDMAAKKAALLEKRLRREKEAQERKQQLELDQEQKKEAARLKAEEEQQKKDEEKARRDYIRNEYMRKKQLRLMVDMDEVIKPRSGSLKKKPRPKSIHRDVVESSTPPVRATGVRPRGFSVSSVSLASLNLADNDRDRDQPNNRKNNRPDSAELFSSCPSTGSRNGEKDWENDSTTSSTPSNAEYTGPKLYKEPSAKSNKHIIQNALAHCCLAGKVNEGQKNKILDEMEKSEANNFLVLFRDAGCQFRSVYTYCPETEEITKLAGIGPRCITTKMIEGLYKYNSDRKQFSQIPAKTMSASVDAITIASHLWQTKKQGTPKKLHPK
ncbi:hypothetical protein L3Q82_021532, partial [Scortum barcoo]